MLVVLTPCGCVCRRYPAAPGIVLPTQSRHAIAFTIALRMPAGAGSVCFACSITQSRDQTHAMAPAAPAALRL